METEKLRYTRSGTCHVAGLSAASHPSPSTASLFYSLAIAKSSGNQNLNFIANKQKQGIVTSDWITENTQPVSGVHSPPIIMLPIVRTVLAFQKEESSLIMDTNPDFVTSIKISATKCTHRKLNEE